MEQIAKHTRLTLTLMDSVTVYSFSFIEDTNMYVCMHSNSSALYTFQGTLTCVFANQEGTLARAFHRQHD